MATAELQSALARFVTLERSLKGDEKSEAQSFLDHFFRALGHAGVIEAGATFEFRVAKKPGEMKVTDGAAVDLANAETTRNANKANSGRFISATSLAACPFAGKIFRLAIIGAL